jgi:threonylcarbamoyladenosine tRNA methylthiotransferase MtaB
MIGWCGAMSLDYRPTVAILTLGCKLNQADSQALARELVAHGCRVIERAGPADVYVINGCSVTHVADRKSRHLVRLARRLSPDASVILAGCYAPPHADGGAELAERIGADMVVPNGDKASLARELLRRMGDGCRLTVPDGEDSRSDERASARTRAFVKIQEGCDEGCSYCIVPRTRGRERSVSPERVVAEVLARQAEGTQEVVLTGTQLGNYGRDLGVSAGPAPLLAAVLNQTGVTRIRLSSLQAQDIDEDVLRLWADPRLCRHFHVPLQSGSDRVLTAMRRRYSARRFAEAVSLVRERVPDVAITTDVMVGFPGETEVDFQETCRLCRDVGFAAIHVFPYSRRPGTAAARMPDQVPAPVKRDRLDRMLALARSSAADFRARFQGRTMHVLWEEARLRRTGRTLWQGLTDNYLRVYTDAENPCLVADVPSADPLERNLTNLLLPTRLVSATADGLWGELAD